MPFLKRIKRRHWEKSKLVGKIGNPVTRCPIFEISVEELTSLPKNIRIVEF